MDKKIKKIFDESFNNHAESIFRYIYFKVSDYDLAQDLTEDTFVRYWKVLVKNKEIHNHRALLYFIAKGLIVDHYRKKKNNKFIPLDSLDERLLGVFDTMEDSVNQKLELEQVYAKLKKLKQDYQELLLLHYIEDLTVKEIAFIQKKEENAVRVNLHRALKALKKQL